MGTFFYLNSMYFYFFQVTHVRILFIRRFTRSQFEILEEKQPNVLIVNLLLTTVGGSS